MAYERVKPQPHNHPIQADSELDPPSYRVVMGVNVNNTMPKLRMPGAVPPLHAHSYHNT